MENWLIVLLLAPPGIWLARCVFLYLSGQRVGGTCKLCVVATFVVAIIWPSLRHFAETSGIPSLVRFPDVGMPDDIGARFLIAGLALLVVGSLLYAVPWLVRRWDRQLYSRQPQYCHGGRLLPLFFPKGGSSEDPLNDVESSGFEAADDGENLDGADAGGGDCASVD